MYSMPRQLPEGFTTLGADVLSDKSGEVFLALQDSLAKARSEIGVHTGVDGEISLANQLVKAFDAAERILASAREVQLKRR